MASGAVLMVEAISLDAGYQQQHRLMAQQQALAVRPAGQAGHCAAASRRNPQLSPPACRPHLLGGICPDPTDSSCR
jgi:hypothetical protein